MEKSLLVFFGKTGVGKSYTAQLFAQEFGYYFYDADLDLTLEMQEAIVNEQVFTDNMRHNYFEHIIGKTQTLLKDQPRIALAQAFFKNKHRHEFIAQFPWAKFVWIDGASQIIENRVLQRNNEISLAYAQRINHLFEVPDFNCNKLINNGGAGELLIEIKKIATNLY